MSITDHQIVEKCQRGDRDAFAELVGRYQSLVCSVAYGATGNLSISEELAQEAFVSAWKSIDQLRDPARLRAWLCGIVRNLANSSSRRRDVMRGAADLHGTELKDTTATDPVESSMEKEETELVDRTLQSLPVMYREPLVLFYREDQSVNRVAELLDLSPAAVKQRLARGRTMLRDEVAAVIERGLRASAPGRAFTIGVLAALPVMSGSVKAATITASAKGVSAMSSASTVVAGAIIGPIVGLLGGWFGYQAGLKSARSERERTFIKKMTAAILGFILVVGILMSTLIFRTQIGNSANLAMWIVGLSLMYTVALFGLILFGNRAIVRIRRETGTLDSVPEEFANSLPAFLQNESGPRSYDSPSTLCGIPLLSIRMSGGIGIGDPRTSASEPAVGWIAVGDKAYGLLIAVGGFSVGTIALGAVGIGVVALGGCGIGAISLGGLAIGLGAIGGLAIGYFALGGAAAAWHTALGGTAIAKQMAIGGAAHAAEANTEAAQTFVDSHWFFELGQLCMSPSIAIPIMLVTIVPLLLLQHKLKNIGTGAA